MLPEFDGDDAQANAIHLNVPIAPKGVAALFSPGRVCAKIAAGVIDFIIFWALQEPQPHDPGYG